MRIEMTFDQQKVERQGWTMEAGLRGQGPALYQRGECPLCGGQRRRTGFFRPVGSYYGASADGLVPGLCRRLCLAR